MTPVDGLSIVARMLTMTAEEMKYGRNDNDCTVFLTERNLSSLSRREKMMGIGNTHTMESTAMIIVLEIRVSMY